MSGVDKKFTAFSMLAVIAVAAMTKYKGFATEQVDVALAFIYRLI